MGDSTQEKRFRISRQTRDMCLLGLAMFLLGFYLRAETQQLKTYQPTTTARISQTAAKTKQQSSRKNQKKKSMIATTKATLAEINPENIAPHTRQKGELLHLIKTRFLQFQPDSPALVEARIQIFRSFVLPAMVNQVSQNFFWIVSIERDLKVEYFDQLKTMLQPYPHFYLTNATLDNRQEGGKDVFEKLNKGNVFVGDFNLLAYHAQEYATVPVLETRIDADEALNINFVKKLQDEAKVTLADQSLDWMYWCVNRAMHWQWFGPGTASADLQAHGGYLESGWDDSACAIPALTVGFREGGHTEKFHRIRAVMLQKELATKQHWCGAMTKGPKCVRVLDALEFPVLTVETPATAVTEKPNKRGKNETERVIENGSALAKQNFGTDQEPVQTLHHMIRQIPPYYMNPPRVDRFKDDKISTHIAKLNPSSLLKKPDNTTLPGKYSKKNRKVFHIVKTRFMQHQPDLLALGRARVELFRTFCLPSMVHQTTQNFFWLIYTDPNLDKEIVDGMVELLKPYPHFYMVLSLEDRRGLGGKDIKNDLAPSDFLTGDTDKLYFNLENVHFLNVLESRLDADDALNINWIKEVQRRAVQVFKEEEGRDWMYWCINKAVEWNWVGPGDRKPLHQFGALVHPRPYDERNFCHTPGMTVGVRRGSFTRSVVKGAHQTLFEKLEKENSPCGPSYSGTDCIAFVGNFTYAALRSRTPTSASMAGVNTNGGKAYRLAAEQGVERWKHAIETFALLPENARHITDYFFQNMKPILEDNLKGQCTEGHSCRMEAHTMLKKMIQLYSLNETQNKDN